MQGEHIGDLTCERVSLSSKQSREYSEHTAPGMYLAQESLASVGPFATFREFAIPGAGMPR